MLFKYELFDLVLAQVRYCVIQRLEDTHLF